MIIRFTVKDNDFSEIIYDYFVDFWMRMLELHPDCSLSNKDSYEELNNWRNREKRVREIMNPNNNHKLSDDEKEFIIKQVKYTFAKYVDRHYIEDADYLKNNLEVEFVDYFVDKFENREVFYWFQHSNKAICQ